MALLLGALALVHVVGPRFGVWLVPPSPQRYASFALETLDVRPEDFQRDAGFIAGARHCPLVHLGERFPALPANRKIIISDWAMKQSPAAAKFLTRKGYTVAGVLLGGMERWQAERLPVEQRTPGSGLDLPETADRD